MDSTPVQSTRIGQQPPRQPRPAVGRLGGDPRQLRCGAGSRQCGGHLLQGNRPKLQDLTARPNRRRNRLRLQRREHQHGLPRRLFQRLQKSVGSGLAGPIKIEQQRELAPCHRRESAPSGAAAPSPARSRSPACLLRVPRCAGQGKPAPEPADKPGTNRTTPPTLRVAHTAQPAPGPRPGILGRFQVARRSGRHGGASCAPVDDATDRPPSHDRSGSTPCHPILAESGRAGHDILARSCASPTSRSVICRCTDA